MSFRYVAGVVVETSRGCVDACIACVLVVHTCVHVSVSSIDKSFVIVRTSTRAI
jgi:hypothetical protein